jgi:TetR/AcrR family transcriptional repressor of mexJK operon
MTDTVAAPPGSRAAKPQQILDAARELFLRDGFSTTSMDAVAKAAGVSKATVYAHFTSKEELFAAMMDAECRRTWPEITSDEIGRLDPIPKLREVAERYVRFITSGYPVALLRVVSAEAARNPTLGRIFYDSAPGAGRKKFAELLGYADAEGRLRVPDPLHAADTFFAMLRGDLHIRVMVGMPLPSEAELVAHAREIVDRFLKAYSA